MMNEDFASGSGNCTTFFLLSKPLDLLLNISFQPLIIVVKHSIIKLEVIATKSTTSIYPMRKSMTILLCEYNFRFES